MARIQPKDLRDKNRIPLKEVIPLPTPFSFILEGNNTCNIACQYCPTGDPDLLKQVGRPMGTMRFETWRKIVDDLKKFPSKIKQFHLYKDGEPLMHRDFTKMVRYLADADVAEVIWAKTNGFLLTPELNSRLGGCGINILGISVNHVTDEGLFKLNKRHVSYDKLRENVADLFSKRGDMKIYIKIADSGLTKDELEKFYTDFEFISDFIATEYLHDKSFVEFGSWKLGTDSNTYDGIPKTKKLVCPYPFYGMAINWNGKVSPCAEDWSHSEILGDATKESVVDIWNGQKMRDFRLSHLNGLRHTHKACGTCEYIEIFPENLDANAERLIDVL